MRDKVDQSATFRYVQQRQVNYVKREAWCLLGFEHCIEILPLIEKKTVNINVLSLHLKLFRTKVGIKSVIRDYLLRNYYVVNV